MAPSDIVRTFFLSLCNFIFNFDSDSNISPAMIKTLSRLRDALRAHEVVLNKIIPLESSETNAVKRFPLSQCLYRGWQTNATIISFVNDCLDIERHPGGIRKKKGCAQHFWLFRLKSRLLKIRRLLMSLSLLVRDYESSQITADGKERLSQQLNRRRRQYTWFRTTQMPGGQDIMP